MGVRRIIGDTNVTLKMTEKLQTGSAVRHSIKIRGRIRILSSTGDILHEQENVINLQNLVQVLYWLTTGTLPNTSCSSSQFILLGVGTFNASYNNFLWTGSVSLPYGLPPTTQITLYACFHYGSNSTSVAIATAEIPVYPGQTITIEWAWSIQDPDNLVPQLLNLSLSGNLSSVSLSSSPTLTLPMQNNLVYLYYIQNTGSTSTTLSQYTVTFTLTPSSGTAVSVTVTWTLSTTVTILAGDAYPLPAAITLE